MFFLRQVINSHEGQVEHDFLSVLRLWQKFNSSCCSVTDIQAESALGPVMILCIFLPTVYTHQNLGYILKSYRCAKDVQLTFKN